MSAEPADAQVKVLIDRVASAWNTHNARAFRDCCAPEAAYVTISGEVLHGPDAIEHRFLRVHRSTNGPPQIDLGGFELMRPEPDSKLAVIKGQAIRGDRRRSAVMTMMARRMPDGEWRLYYIHFALVLPEPPSLWRRALSMLRQMRQVRV